jgi:hypothetical protein
MSRKWLFENENLEGRGGVVLKAPRRRFDLATTSFISGYGSWVSVAAIKLASDGFRSMCGMGSLIKPHDQDGASCTSYSTP